MYNNQERKDLHKIQISLFRSRRHELPLRVDISRQPSQPNLCCQPIRLLTETSRI